MSDLIPLSDWLRSAPEGVVARDESGTITKSELISKVTFWCRVLPVEPGQRWVVYHQDMAEFLALVLALWQMGCTACISGDNRPATIDRLRPQVDGFVGDFPESIMPVEMGGVVPVSEMPEWKPLEPGFKALEIYTSGSTGAPKSVLKSVEQLESELIALERLWPGHNRAAVISTVTHQHLYGLTFRLFWPLCKGQVFESSYCQYTEEIFSRAQKYSEFMLVSTPSHLGRLNSTLPWQELAQKCVGIISSAAPLQREDSLEVAALFKTPVREIYGSSETGAIAWRIQSLETDALWQPLPGVKASQTESSTLSVKAPHIAEEILELPDRVEFSETGQFRLKGRVDRVVKVEGKRLSLAEVEQVAETIDLLARVKALTVIRSRTEIALVAQLSPLGVRYLQQHGKRQLVRHCKELLRDYFEPVVLPRRWRFVEQMPYNQQGKITMDSLQAMFQQEEVRWPEVVGITVEGDMAELLLRIPPELIYFDGHFSGNPILPGITQVHWAEYYARQHFHIEGAFCRLEAVKFQQVIFPDTVVSVRLEYMFEKQKLSFRFFSDKGTHSSGRICFN